MEIIITDIIFKPYVRMTQRSKWVNPQAKEYLRSKGNLRDNMAAYMFNHKLEMMPAHVPLRIYLYLYVPSSPGHRCDLDNQIKAILDAGNKTMYPDDRWIDKIQAERMIGGPDSQIVICLNRLVKLP